MDLLIHQFNVKMLFKAPPDQDSAVIHEFGHVAVLRYHNMPRYSQCLFNSWLRFVWGWADKTKDDVSFQHSADDVILVRFKHARLKYRVLNSGPWTFRKWAISTTDWDPDLPLSCHALTSIPLSLQIHNMPAHYHQQRYFMNIGSQLGRVLSVQTSVPIPDSTDSTAKFAKLRLVVDVHHPVAMGSYFSYGDSSVVWLTYRYDRLPFLCFNCGHFTHETGHCSLPRNPELRAVYRSWVGGGDGLLPGMVPVVSSSGSSSPSEVRSPLPDNTMAIVPYVGVAEVAVASSPRQLLPADVSMGDPLTNHDEMETRGMSGDVLGLAAAKTNLHLHDKGKAVIADCMPATSQDLEMIPSDGVDAALFRGTHVFHAAGVVNRDKRPFCPSASSSSQLGPAVLAPFLVGPAHLAPYKPVFSGPSHKPSKVEFQLADARYNLTKIHTFSPMPPASRRGKRRPYYPAIAHPRVANLPNKKRRLSIALTSDVASGVQVGPLLLGDLSVAGSASGSQDLVNAGAAAAQSPTPP